MATQKLNLTRDQLATFLKNFEQVKQFERLFQIADEVAPASDTTGISIQAGTAQATANDALAQIAALAQELAVSDSVSDVKATQALDQIAILAQDAAVSIASVENKVNQALALLGQLATSVEGLQMSPVRVPPRRTRFGSFLDTTDQIAGGANTPQAITFNTTDLSSGVFLRSPSTSEIEVDTEGVYNLQFSAQLDKNSGGTANFWIWPRVNGVDVPNSASQVQIQGNDAEIFTAANFFFDLKAGDYIELMFAVSDVSVRLEHFAASAFHPAIPSIIVTVSNNIRSYPS